MKTENFHIETALLRPKSFIFISADFFLNDHFLEKHIRNIRKTSIGKLKILWDRFETVWEVLVWILELTEPFS